MPVWFVSRTGLTNAGGRTKLAEIEIGIFKSGRQAYGFDDIAIVPSRRTRDPEDVDISWEMTPTASTCLFSARRWTG